MAETAAESFRDWARREWERRHPSVGLVLSQEEVVRFLVAIARVEDTRPLCDDADCADCNAMRAQWWGLCNALEPTWYQTLQVSLAASGTPFPEGPWEEEENA